MFSFPKRIKSNKTTARRLYEGLYSCPMEDIPGARQRVGKHGKHAHGHGTLKNRIWRERCKRITRKYGHDYTGRISIVDRVIHWADVNKAIGHNGIA